MGETKHLWDEAHPYYCQRSNYYANEAKGGPFHYDSWASFEKEFGDADMDYNLVVRWDWHRASVEDESDHDELAVYFLGQRKGLFWCNVVRVTEADEPAVRAWLASRFAYLLQLWEPLAAPAPAAPPPADREACELDAFQAQAAARAGKHAGATTTDAQLLLTLGLCEEAGEAAGVLKKCVRAGAPLDLERYTEELGDALWQLAMCAHAAGTTLGAVAAANIKKNHARYPGGFSVARAPGPRDAPLAPADAPPATSPTAPSRAELVAELHALTSWLQTEDVDNDRHDSAKRRAREIVDALTLGDLSAAELAELRARRLFGAQPLSKGLR